MLRGATLALNVPVKVRVLSIASGVLVATRIEVKPQSDARVAGLVDAISASASTLTVLGVTVTTTSSTVFNDKSDQKLKSFKLSDIRTGDYVEVRGTAGSGTALTATVVERQKADVDARTTLRGPASNLSAPNFSILGVTVMTNADTQFVGLGAPAQAAAAFFAQAAGQIVRVRGSFVGGVFVADQVKIDP